MKSKTCGECKKHTVDCIVAAKATACKNFEPKAITNGDRIIAGGIRAIAEFAGNPCEYCRYYKDFCELPDGKMCEDAIEEYLNAPAESEGKDE